MSVTLTLVAVVEEPTEELPSLLREAKVSDEDIGDDRLEDEEWSLISSVRWVTMVTLSCRCCVTNYSVISVWHYLMQCSVINDCHVACEIVVVSPNVSYHWCHVDAWRIKVSSYVAQYPILRTAQSTLHFTSLADLFNQTPSQLLCEASSHAANNAQRLFVQKYPPLSIARYSII